MTGDGPTAQSVRDAYDLGAKAWEAGPARQVYRPLARALVAHCPTDLRGRHVLDVGAGTGALTGALRDAGARVTAFDFAVGMIAEGRDARPPGAAADATRLPVARASVDGFASAFCFNHLAHPGAGFAEAARVVAPGGVVLVATFGEQEPHPAKAIVDDVAARYGYVAPQWHHTIKTEVEPLTASADKLADLARAAGLVGIDAIERSVDVGLADAATLVQWRLGMASLTPFVLSLPPDRLASLTADAEAALGAAPPPHLPVVALLASRVQA